MQFEVTELVEILGHRIEIIERPLQGSEFLAADSGVNSMDDSLQSMDGTLEAVRHARPGEIHLLIQKSNMDRAKGPSVFIIRNDSNLFYELTVYNESGSLPWRHQTT
jgi:hypothetical protein